MGLATQLEAAWQERDFARVWQLLYMLGGKGYGPKRRRYNVSAVARLSKADWLEHVKQLAQRGGLGAEEVPWNA